MDGLDRARASLLSPIAGWPSASADLDPAGDIDGSLSILSIEDIGYYDHNPRTGENPKYTEIRASMVANGMTSIIAVTRRPGGSRYFPSAGGNTRLRIAKELAAAGDGRFLRLRVMVKAWTSESKVIAAHLGENENRGETSYWEKAVGVHAFKQELEKEDPGRSLSGAELNRELKKNGMDFGVKSVQNFLFAVEHLAPVGPWLRARDVNAVLRPRLSEYLDLMKRFGHPGTAQSAVDAHLEDVAVAMRDVEARNRERDDAERIAIELDVERLVLELGRTLAGLLDVPLEQFRRMVDALSADPRLQPQDLLALPESAAHTPSMPSQEASSPALPDLEADVTSSRPLAQHHASATAQRELGAMAGVVGGTGRIGSAVHGTASNSTATSLSRALEDSISPENRRQRLFLDLEDVITAMSRAVPIHDFVLRVADMPFGYMVDVPISASRIGDADVSASAGMRVVVWQFLAALSGQVHDAYWQRVADLPFIQTTRWSQKIREGLVPFAQYLMGHLQVGCGPMNSEQTLFDLFVGAVPLWTVLADDRLGPLALRLMQLRRAIQDLDPGAHPALGMYLKFPE